MTAPLIITRYDPPPIPVRIYDWSATTTDYEPGMAIGYGYTRLDAINDLIQQMGELEPFPGNGAYL